MLEVYRHVGGTCYPIFILFWWLEEHVPVKRFHHNTRRYIRTSQTSFTYCAFLSGPSDTVERLLRHWEQPSSKCKTASRPTPCVYEVTSQAVGSPPARIHTLVRSCHVIRGVTPKPWTATVTPIARCRLSYRHHATERGTEPNKKGHKNKSVNVEGVQLDQGRGQWQALTKRATIFGFH